MRLLLFFLITSITIFFSCNTTEPEMKVQYPPGYQHDIPWPSLADSPWPIKGHDVQSTGRSNLEGPSLGQIEWTKESKGVRTSVVIGSDSTIYSASFNKLIAYNPNGEIKWQYQVPREITATPLLCKDGTIVFGHRDSKGLRALNPDGTLKWELSIYMATDLLSIGKSGNLYCINPDNILYEINKDGQILRQLKIPELALAASEFSFSPDGNTIYISGSSCSVIAVDLVTFCEKWKYGKTKMYCSPLVESGGRIIVFTQSDSLHTLAVLDPSGNEIWKYEYPSKASDPTSAPAIDKLGNIYFGVDTLFKMSYDGKVIWKKGLDSMIGCHIVCDKNGDIYFGQEGEILYQIKITKFSKDGFQLWSISGREDMIGGCPAIGANMRLYFPGWNAQKMYSIK